MRIVAQKKSAQDFATKGYSRRHRALQPAATRETLAEWEARGGQVTRCEPITDDPAAAIARAAARSKREAAPKVVKASPRNTAKEKA